ncbi:membrane-bound alkaline phosphatase-like [Anthonomus grandis grandis]|uniref:membrane-bound alkaline phosphatase-like n=1 Tax=Anthonomus grandis grandis TaxID=2921223 RepID=UPI002166ABE6|nr:membrane-bound alkaline phosphatase-like [Anthonomus grandis grandis]
MAHTFFVTLILLFLVSALCKPSAHKKTEEEDDEIHPFQNKFVRNKSDEEVLREQTQDYWKNNAIKSIREKFKYKHNFHEAKNVIFFMGDGMSIATIAATRVYLGGEETSLAFENFPITGLSKTYCVNHQTPDSACSATAYLGGVKANLGTIGVSAGVQLKNCTAMKLKENRVDSLAKKFQDAGRRTGFVTSTRVTHASPAAIYAHTSERHWESDSDVEELGGDPKNCEDIAHQLIFGETGQNLNVILGGGRKNFLSRDATDEEGNSGARSDGINLINEWKHSKAEKNQSFEYVWNKQQLLSVKNETEYLLGLFHPGHLKYNKDRDVDVQPSLEEMTEAAIRVLDKEGSRGYFLFVEGGRIDTAHHYTLAHKALDETAEFSKAISRALELTNEADTLIIVTADHAHTMTYAGYAARGSDVFGYAGMGSDKHPYTILNYANGPGYRPNSDEKRFIPSQEALNEIGFQWPATVPREKETHGADDVAIYAKGPWDFMFSGVMEQNIIPYLVTLASCINPDFQCHEIRPKLA